MKSKIITTVLALSFLVGSQVSWGEEAAITTNAEMILELKEEIRKIKGREKLNDGLNSNAHKRMGIYRNQLQRQINENTQLTKTTFNTLVTTVLPRIDDRLNALEAKLLDTSLTVQTGLAVVYHLCAKEHSVSSEEYFGMLQEVFDEEMINMRKDNPNIDRLYERIRTKKEAKKLMEETN